MMGVKMSEQQVQEFRLMVGAVMFPALTDAELVAFDSQAYQEISEAIGRWGQLHRYTDASLAIVNFNEWYAKKPINPNSEQYSVTDGWERVHLSVEVAFDDGVKYTADVIISVADLDAKAGFIADNLLALERGVQYAASRGKKLAASRKAEASAPPQQQYTEERVTMLKITKGFDKGKYFFKAHAGQWQQWGVPLYEETMQAAGIDHVALPMGETPMTRDIIVLLKAGKASKVKEIL